jgi:hypothetical protein
MHAILVTMGTDGDVFPYVGLGGRLRGRGHRVTLAGPETYQGLAAQHGLGFHCLVSQAAADEFLASPGKNRCPFPFSPPWCENPNGHRVRPLGARCAVSFMASRKGKRGKGKRNGKARIPDYS